jgi:hypothetical protein
MTLRLITGMDRTAIPAWTRTKRSQKINFSEKFKIIALSNGAGFHKVLTCIARKTRTHENIQNVMHMRLCFLQGYVQMICKSARKIRMTAMVILCARQQVARVGITARANDVVHRSAKRVDAIPTQRIRGDRRHWA